MDHPAKLNPVIRKLTPACGAQAALYVLLFWITKTRNPLMAGASIVLAFITLYRVLYTNNKANMPEIPPSIV